MNPVSNIQIVPLPSVCRQNSPDQNTYMFWLGASGTACQPTDSVLHTPVLKLHYHHMGNRLHNAFSQDCCRQMYMPTDVTLLSARVNRRQPARLCVNRGPLNIVRRTLIGSNTMSAAASCFTNRAPLPKCSFHMSNRIRFNRALHPCHLLSKLVH